MPARGSRSIRPANALSRVVLLNALATRGGGALTRVQEVAERAPHLWHARLCLLRNHEVAVPPVRSATELVPPWPLDRAPVRVVRAFEGSLLARACRATGARVVLHYGAFVPLRRRTGVAQVLCFTNLGPWEEGAGGRSWRNRLLRRAFERTALRAERIVVESEATRELLEARYPWVRGRVVGLRNGVSIPRVERGRGRGFVVVGDILSYRRLTEVARAYARLPEDVRLAHPLVLIGRERDPAEGERLRELGRGLASGAVQLVGPLPREEVLARVASAAAFVSWSSIENGPNAVLEALALDAPLILSDLPVHREYAGTRARYAQEWMELSELMRAAATQDRSDGPPFVGPLDSWDEHVSALGEILKEARLL